MPKIDYQVMMTTLMGSVERTVSTMCGKKLTLHPEIKKRDIITWEKKMRVFPFEKFHEVAFVSIVNFNLVKGGRPNEAFGVIVLYMSMFDSFDILNSLGVEVGPSKDVDRFDEMPEEFRALADCVGEICNTIAGGFKTDLVGIGYPDFTLSPPMNFMNAVNQDVVYPQREKFKYEICFPLEGGQKMYIDVVMPLI